MCAVSIICVHFAVSARGIRCHCPSVLAACPDGRIARRSRERRIAQTSKARGAVRTRCSPSPTSNSCRSAKNVDSCRHQAGRLRAHQQARAGAAPRGPAREQVRRGGARRDFVIQERAYSLLHRAALQRERRVDRRLVVEQPHAAGVEAVARRLVGRRDEQRRDLDVADARAAPRSASAWRGSRRRPCRAAASRTAPRARPTDRCGHRPCRCP